LEIQQFLPWLMEAAQRAFCEAKAVWVARRKNYA
jgi:hypothetical protein